jgi:2'-5' RNA ligase
MWSTFDMRFSIVCYLDPQSIDEVRSIQEELSKLTGARASLDLWMPHVTVGDGIEVDDSELSAIEATFAKIANNTAPLDIYLHNIIKMDSRKGGAGEVTTPYGLYLEVQKDEALMSLVGNISKAVERTDKWYLMPSPYHPHCALAFKDLDREGFELGARYLDDKFPAFKTKLDHVALVEMLSNETREFVRFGFRK